MYAVRVFLSLLLCATLSWSASMRLPSFPLAVKTPYLSVWLPGHLSHDLPNATPEFWRNQKLHWIVVARVHGTAYCLLGCHGGRTGTVPAKQKAINFTSTHTYVTLDAGRAEVTLDFFSPVDPDDHVRQSLPYSYLTVSATSNDGSGLDFGVMTAIDATWLGPRGEPYATYDATNGTKILRLNGLQAVDFAEDLNMALWGDVVLAARDVDEHAVASCQTGDAETMLASFAETGRLTGPVASLSSGSIAACVQSAARPGSMANTTFAIGLHQDEQIQYFNGAKIERWAGYFRSKVSNVSEAVQYFFNDHAAALAQSERFDRRVRELGQSVSTNYSELLESSVRQSFAGQQVTISSETLDTSMPYSFIKEISTDGNVNTLADLIPKALPIFHVLNPEYTRMMLEPVLRFSVQGWPLNHAVHDIGKRYPNATGENPCIEEFLPLDSTTVLLWMIYLHQKATGNTEMRDNYADILQRYADYTVRYGLYPVLQRSSVDAIGSATNQSALSISAAIALNAYGKMTGQSNYSDLAIEYANTIFDLGTDTNNTHFLAHYGDESDSWVTTYPLAFDALLGLNTFNSSVHRMQSDHYRRHAYPFGIQFNSNIPYTLMEFQMWAAATSADDVRDHVINAVHMFYNQTTGPIESVPGPSQWRVLPGKNEGVWTHFSKAKSVIGSMFMVVAVQEAANRSEAKTWPSFKPTAPVLSATEEPFTAKKTHHLDLRDTVQDYDIPYEVPLGASRRVDRSFLGLSFETADFPTYLGNSSKPNAFSRDLIYNLIDTSNASTTIRIGSAAGDFSTYDPEQAIAVQQSDDTSERSLSIGPSFFDSVKALGRERDVEWAYQIPFAAYNINNSVLGAQKAMEVTPRMRLFALEIGHKPNLYAGSSRWDGYSCRHYADELFQFKIALRRGIGRIFGQFMALGLSTDRINSEVWGLEECLAVGIDAQDDLKAVSVHYSQVESGAEVDFSNLPRHSAIQRSHDEILPHTKYVRDIYPCFPFVISEASFASRSTNKRISTTGHHDDQASLGITMWNLDFLLYSMSTNVSRVFMHQACDSLSSAWRPEPCSNTQAGSLSSDSVNGPYYALTFVASFVKDAKNFRVIPIQQADDSVVYAGYESGKLSKIAIVSYPSKGGAKDASGAEKRDIKLRITPEITVLEQRVRINANSIASRGGRSRKAMTVVASQAQIPLAPESDADVNITDGILSIAVGHGEAVLLQVR